MTAASNVEVPALGESITEAVLLQWLKNEGDHVAVDEPICELESDKATVDLPAPIGGILHPAKKAGETARVGEIIARIDPDGAEAPEANHAAADRQDGQAVKPVEAKASKTSASAPPGAASPPEVAAEESAERPAPKEDFQSSAQVAARQSMASAASRSNERDVPRPGLDNNVRRVPMSKIRRSIAQRMVRAVQTTAMLTTFNEIDMTAVQELRSRHQEQFKQTHGVSLGLMSLFARASVLALKQFPALNAQIEEDDILYHENVNLGVAVSTDRGLVVPVIRDVERLSLASIEKEIKRAAAAAKEGKLSLQELSGGTFTITNGGVFGSLLSTPILNPPQTGILGMHAIQDRPVAINRQVEVRPMMYIALTYDHRLVDGHEAVSFLVRLKQLLEDPVQMILEI